MEPPINPTPAARRMVSAAAAGASPKPFSRSAETGRSVASTMARAWARASSRVTRPSRLPSTPASAPLDVARAWKPRPARMRAEPASHGLGIRKAPGPWCSARKRVALSLWVAAMGFLHAGSVAEREAAPRSHAHPLLATLGSSRPRAPIEGRRQALLDRRVVVVVVPPGQVPLVGDRGEARRVPGTLARGQALDHRVDVRAEEEGNRVAVVAHRGQGAVGRRLEAPVRPAVHHVARVQRVRAWDVGHVEPVARRRPNL